MAWAKIPDLEVSNTELYREQDPATPPASSTMSGGSRERVVFPVPVAAQE